MENDEMKTEEKEEPTALPWGTLVVAGVLLIAFIIRDHYLPEGIIFYDMRHEHENITSDIWSEKKLGILSIALAFVSTINFIFNPFKMSFETCLKLVGLSMILAAASVGVSSLIVF